MKTLSSLQTLGKLKDESFIMVRISRALTEGIPMQAEGTPQWTAPEVFSRELKYSLPADVYSFAIG